MFERGANALVLLGVLASFFVLIEPAPTDWLMLAAIPTSVIAGRSGGPGMRALFILGSAYLTGLAIGTINSGIDPSVVTFNMLSRAYLLLSAYAIAAYLYKADWSQTSLLVNMIVASAVLLAVIVILTKFHLIPNSDIFFRDVSQTRVRGTFKDPNVMGPYAAMGMMFAIFQLFEKRSPMYLTAAVVILMSVILSGSRGAILTACTSIAVFASLVSFSNTLSRNLIRNLVLAAIAIGTMIAGSWAMLEFGDFKEQYAARLESHAYDTDRFASQMTLLTRALNEPLGHGAGAATGAYKGLSPHNVYVKVLYEGGIVAFLAYVGMIGVSVWRCFAAWSAKSNESSVRLISAVVLGTIVGHALNSCFIDSTHWRHIFVLFGFAAALPLSGEPARATFLGARTAGPARGDKAATGTTRQSLKAWDSASS